MSGNPSAFLNCPNVVIYLISVGIYNYIDLFRLCFCFFSQDGRTALRLASEEGHLGVAALLQAIIEEATNVMRLD